MLEKLRLDRQYITSNNHRLGKGVDPDVDLLIDLRLIAMFGDGRIPEEKRHKDTMFEVAYTNGEIIFNKASGQIVFTNYGEVHKDLILAEYCNGTLFFQESQ